MSPILASTLLIVLMQFVFALGASTVSGILAQDAFSAWQNDLTASIIAVIAALLNAYVIGLITGDLAIIVGTMCGIATILLLASLKSLQQWTRFLQSNLFVIRGGHVMLFPPDDDDDVSTYVTKPVMGVINPIQLPEVPTLPSVLTEEEDGHRRGKK